MNAITRGGIEFIAVLFGLSISLWIDNNAKENELKVATTEQKKKDKELKLKEEEQKRKDVDLKVREEEQKIKEQISKMKSKK